MVHSEAGDVDGYMSGLSGERAAALAEVRRLCLEELTGFDEVMAYGMPAYERDGVCEIAFAAQKQYLSFYLMRGDVREAFEERLAGQDMGKGCLRFRKPESVDHALLRDLLRATAARPGESR
ncbi:iron chaperone [Streptomyces sp. bgisy095]|uniref:iron chaperone n=1 Tax=unclassified Streptomyces TaxID=2593676 RepID=UPI003D72EF31